MIRTAKRDQVTDPFFSVSVIRSMVGFQPPALVAELAPIARPEKDPVPT
jgi:hypothetical protein